MARELKSNIFCVCFHIGSNGSGAEFEQFFMFSASAPMAREHFNMSRWSRKIAPGAFLLRRWCSISPPGASWLFSHFCGWPRGSRKICARFFVLTAFSHIDVSTSGCNANSYCTWGQNETKAKRQQAGRQGRKQERGKRQNKNKAKAKRKQNKATKEGEQGFGYHYNP